MSFLRTKLTHLFVVCCSTVNFNLSVNRNIIQASIIGLIAGVFIQRIPVLLLIVSFGALILLIPTSSGIVIRASKSDRVGRDRAHFWKLNNRFYVKRNNSRSAKRAAVRRSTRVVKNGVRPVVTVTEEQSNQFVNLSPLSEARTFTC